MRKKTRSRGCGTSIVHGASGYDEANSCSNAGAVYVYVRDGETWSAQAYIKAANAEANDRFGISRALALSGDTLAVGAPGEDSQGHVPK